MIKDIKWTIALKLVDSKNIKIPTGSVAVGRILTFSIILNDGRNIYFKEYPRIGINQVWSGDQITDSEKIYIGRRLKGPIVRKEIEQDFETLVEKLKVGNIIVTGGISNLL